MLAVVNVMVVNLMVLNVVAGMTVVSYRCGADSPAQDTRGVVIRSSGDDGDLCGVGETVVVDCKGSIDEFSAEN